MVEGGLLYGAPLIFAAIVGALSSAAFAIVLVGARRSAWSPAAAIGGTALLGGVFNASLGLVPLTRDSEALIYVLGFGLSALAALLPTHSLQHIVLGASLGAIGGFLAATVRPADPIMIVILEAIIGGLVAVAISAAPRPKSHLKS